jgi:hypothetical protein
LKKIIIQEGKFLQLSSAVCWNLCDFLLAQLQMDWFYVVTVNDRQEKQIEVVSVHERAITNNQVT